MRQADSPIAEKKNDDVERYILDMLAVLHAIFRWQKECDWVRLTIIESGKGWSLCRL